MELFRNRQVAAGLRTPYRSFTHLIHKFIMDRTQVYNFVTQVFQLCDH